MREREGMREIEREREICHIQLFWHCIMNAQTCQLLLDAHNETQQWNSVLKVNHGSSIVDVSCPGNSIPEPTCGSIPDDCYYEFDPTIF